MKYLLLHTNGEDAKLYRLKTPGRFKIWAKETLEEHGFTPEHANYYAVIEFNTQPIKYQALPQLKQKSNTYRARIIPLSDIVGIM